MILESQELRDVCSLSDEDFESRRALLTKELFPKIRRREERPNGLLLAFDDTRQMRLELEDFVEAEKVCCSSIEWSLRRESGELRLEIDGIDPKSGLFSGEGIDRPASSQLSENKSSGRGARLFRSIGAGSVGAIFVYCFLPLGVAMGIGATPLMLLDNPWVIAASALGMGFLCWRWLGNRDARNVVDADGESGSSCGC